MRFVFVGGGSGGHFYPLIATAQSLQTLIEEQKGIAPELFYMGPDPYDEGALFSVNMTYTHVPAGKRRRYFSLKNFIAPFISLYGVCVALIKLFILYPDAVLSKGGGTSIPVVVAAWILRIPVVIHESDAVAGSANKLASRFARYIAISYPEASTAFPKEKTILTGIPIRKELIPASEESGGETNTILVIGGSQGAERINNLILESLDELLPEYEIIHQTGEHNIDAVKQSAEALTQKKELLQKYRPQPFLEVSELHSYLRGASLVITRAGSTSLHEIALHGKPSIVIPIPESISHDQRTNAYTYARGGAASVLEESNLTPHLLVSEIRRIMSDHTLRAEMQEGTRSFGRKDAGRKVAEILTTIYQEHV